MAPATATRSRSGLPGPLRGLLLGGLLVAAVIAGLLAMHTLNLHGTASAHAHAAASAPAFESGETHRSTAQSGAASSHGTTDAADRPETPCADCGSDDPVTMATACVLALLLALLVLTPPRLLRGWSRQATRSFLITRVFGRVLPEAPSLHVLCISRT